MNTHIQIRNVPAAVHKKLQKRAKSEDLTISDYVRRLIARDLSTPTLRELAARMRKEPPAALGVDLAKLVREDRESH